MIPIGRRFVTLTLALAVASALGVRIYAQAAAPVVTLPAADAATPATPSFRFGGFGDVELHTSSDSTREGLDLASFDLYSIAMLSEKWSALGDVVMSRSLRHHESGQRVVADADLQRLYLAYTRSDTFTAEFGEMATGLIHWNEREHRSRFLQTPIDVPAVARRPEENGAWPLRFVGAWASGRSHGPLGLGYDVGLGAGSGRDRGELPLLSNDRSPAALLSFSLAPLEVDGLEVAVAVYGQRIRTRQEDLQERDITLSMSFVRNGTEVRAEYARMNHTATQTGTTYQTTGYYALFSKRLSGSASRLRPYVLLDHLQVDPREQYLQNVTPENAWAAGLRYDISARFSLKGEYRSQRAPLGERETLLGMQIGFSF